MSNKRRKVEALLKVPSGRFLIRLIRPDRFHWNWDTGLILAGALESDECRGSEKEGEESYGASFWIEADDKNSGVTVEQLEQLNREWKTWGVSRVRAEDIEAIGARFNCILEFRYSKEDATEYGDLAEHHATLIFQPFNRTVRRSVLDELDEGVKRPGSRPPTPPDESGSSDP